MRAFYIRSRLWLLTVASGGGLFLLDGCDPNVRDTMLTGVGSAATGLATTFIQAFIQSLMSEEEGAAATVKAIIEQAPRLFA